MVVDGFLKRKRCISTTSAMSTVSPTYFTQSSPLVSELRRSHRRKFNVVKRDINQALGLQRMRPIVCRCGNIKRITARNDESSTTADIKNNKGTILELFFSYNSGSSW